MDCKKFEKHLSAYIEGMLEGEFIREMNEHRAACPKCAEQHELQLIVFASLSNTKPVKAPKGLADRILASVESEIPDNVVEFTPLSVSASTVKEGIISIDCRIFEDNVAAYVEGLSEGNLLDGMLKHRASCTSCDRLAQVHTMILASLNETEPVRAPVGLADRILAAVEVEQAETERAPGFRRFGIFSTALATAGSLVAASIAIIGLINFQILSINPQSSNFDFFWILASKGNWFTVAVTAWAHLASFVLTAKEYTAALIPNLLPESTSIFINPVQIPMLSMSFPPYYFAALMLFALYAWSYLRTPATSDVSIFSS
ncbi:MAG: hypothetical protein HOC71_18990 [Candidatus Latescibacteria bacterium]|nr:hypothetical protein [Candidatus Latescibacterota bacterium]